MNLPRATNYRPPFNHCPVYIVEATYFQLYKRTKHVLSEARRVLQFRQTCLLAAGSSNANDSIFFEGLGRLMNDSQSSCSLLYECSCPELDNLTCLARESGAYGSRLTGRAPHLPLSLSNLFFCPVSGAGWGGCTISLVAENKVDDFIQKLKETYPPYKNLEGDALSEVIFATKPSSGACGMFFPLRYDRFFLTPFSIFKLENLCDSAHNLA